MLCPFVPAAWLKDASPEPFPGGSHPGHVALFVSPAAAKRNRRHLVIQENFRPMHLGCRFLHFLP
ncbi:MAG: hypothetical protein AMJ62_05465 [Myxococcales bacterium SG8_38]|nr:MAG: hypothetical protein AMJ62_05465 [Myxococcales bacterium SG8_38]